VLHGLEGSIKGDTMGLESTGGPTVEDRLRALERANSILISVAVAAGLVAAVLLLVVEGQIASVPRPQPLPTAVTFTSVDVGRLGVDDLQAKRVVVPGKTPGTSVVLGQSTEGMPMVAFLDRGDKVRMSLFLGSDGAPWVALYDAQGMRRSVYALNPAGEPSLAFVDSKGRPQVGLAALNDGSCGVHFEEYEGRQGSVSITAGDPKVGTYIGVNQKNPQSSIELRHFTGGSRLGIADQTGSRIALEVMEKGAARVSVLGPGGESEGVVGMVADPSGSPFVGVTDKRGRSRGFTAEKEGPTAP
jgi:hypothetical protein